MMSACESSPSWLGEGSCAGPVSRVCGWGGADGKEPVAVKSNVHQPHFMTKPLDQKGFKRLWGPQAIGVEGRGLDFLLQKLCSNCYGFYLRSILIGSCKQQSSESWGLSTGLFSEGGSRGFSQNCHCPWTNVVCCSLKGPSQVGEPVNILLCLSCCKGPGLDGWQRWTTSL